MRIYPKLRRILSDRERKKKGLPVLHRTKRKASCGNKKMKLTIRPTLTVLGTVFPDPRNELAASRYSYRNNWSMRDPSTRKPGLSLC